MGDMDKEHRPQDRAFILILMSMYPAGWQFISVAINSSLRWSVCSDNFSFLNIGIKMCACWQRMGFSRRYKVAGIY